MIDGILENTNIPRSIYPNSRPNIRGKIDIAWAHCKLIREGDKIAMMCIYYDKTIRRDGINRLKGHSAGEMGQVSLCKKVPLDVCYQMKHNIEENKSKNKNRRIDEEHDLIGYIYDL